MLQQLEAVQAQRETRKLHYSFARSPSEVAEAQRLRYKVFAEEMGARLPGRERLDRDGFDAFCEHLLVRDYSTGKVVGTYRILDPHMANEAGGYYAAGEFDMTRLLHLSPSMVEIGRSCVHPDYRNGATIGLLWAGLAHFMRQNGYEYLIGSASVGMADGGHNAAAVYNNIKGLYSAPAEYSVFPRCPLPLQALARDMNVACPPLIKGYLRAGAWVCGEPHWDPDFNTADMLMMLPMARMSQRYASHFLK